MSGRPSSYTSAGVEGVYFNGVTFGYQFSRSVNGKRVQRAKFGFPSKAEAKKARRAALVDFDRTGRANARQTVAQLSAEWLDNRRKKGLSPATLSAYKGAAFHVVKHLGHCDPSKLVQDDCDSLFEALAADGLAVQTRQHVWRALRAMLRWGVQNAKLARDPLRDAEGPTARHDDAPDERVRAWTSDEVALFIAWCESEPVERQTRATLWRLMLVTGLRRGEAVGLDWSNVCLDGCREQERPHVHVVKNVSCAGANVYVGRPKTKSGRRIVALLGNDAQLLHAHKARQAAERLASGGKWRGRSEHDGDANVDDAVFTMPYWHDVRPTWRVQPHYANTQLPEACVAAGVPVMSVHELRHTHASALVAAGWPITAVSARLGHSNSTITLNTYAHFAPSSTDLDRLEELALAARTTA